MIPPFSVPFSWSLQQVQRQRSGIEKPKVFARLVYTFVVARHPAFGRKCIVAICAIDSFVRLVLAFVVARRVPFGRKCTVAICALFSVSFAPLGLCMLELRSFVCVCSCFFWKI